MNRGRPVKNFSSIIIKGILPGALIHLVGGISRSGKTTIGSGYFLHDSFGRGAGLIPAGFTVAVKT